MGCLDEIGVLEHGQCFIQASIPSLTNCFSKHGSRFSGSKNDRHVVVGTVVIAKNPCLHPGDIRILEAVDIPALHHLVDCLIFPQKGDRPHANEASGSDLDGDLYFVTWDECLIPPGKRSWVAMDYTPAEAKLMPRSVTHRVSCMKLFCFYHNLSRKKFCLFISYHSFFVLYKNTFRNSLKLLPVIIVFLFCCFMCQVFFSVYIYPYL